MMKFILIVDDDPVNRLVTRAMLKKQGYDTIEACDGLSAIDVFERRNIDLILMDISMPGMDGVQVTKEIRKMSCKKSDVPILAFTAHAFESDQERFLAAGMNACIAKPAKGEQLKKAISEFVPVA